MKSVICIRVWDQELGVWRHFTEFNEAARFGQYLNDRDSQGHGEYEFKFVPKRERDAGFLVNDPRAWRKALFGFCGPASLWEAAGR